jgi:transcriptional regulator GlxA family with amidase domain
MALLMYTAAAMLYPDALATSVTLPMEILAAASQMASVRHRGEPRVRFLLTAPDSQTVRLSSGLTLKPDALFSELPALDLLLLPAIWRNPVPTINAAAPWLERLRDLGASDTRICSVGTASCLLAEAGLLRGRPATTHWNYFDHFARRYPAVQLQTRHLITQSGNIYCVGSVNSIADLMVHIVEDWFGSRIARAVENQFSPEIRQTFRDAAYQNEAQSSHHDEIVLEGQLWLQSNLGESISIAARFHTAIGLSPMEYLQSLRITEAKELLRQSNLSVSEIAWRVGLNDTSYFSKLFREQVGMAPLRYRGAVRGKLFTPGDKSSRLSKAPTSR